MILIQLDLTKQSGQTPERGGQFEEAAPGSGKQASLGWCLRTGFPPPGGDVAEGGLAWSVGQASSEKPSYSLLVQGRRGRC